MNRKAVIAICALWVVMGLWHAGWRIERLSESLPAVVAPREDRLRIERGSRDIPVDGSDYSKFRSLFERFDAVRRPLIGGVDGVTRVLLVIFTGLLLGAFVRDRFAVRARPLEVAERIGIVLAAFAFALALGEGLAPRPAWSHWDAWAVWDIKTKAVIREGFLPSRFLTDPEYRFTHPEYPLLWPWMQAAMSNVAGGFDSRIIRLLPVACAAGMSLVTAGLIAELGMASRRWLVAGIVSTLPIVLNHSSNGYVDWPLAAVEASALLLALRSRRGAVGGWAVGLAAGLAANLKMEGSIFGIGLLIALAMDGRGSRAGRSRWMQASAAFLLLALPWQIIRIRMGISAADFGLPIAQVVSEFPNRVFLFVRGFLLEAFGAGPNGRSLADWWIHVSASWTMFWFAVAYAVIKGWRCLSEPALRIPVIVLGVQVLGALGAYATTVRDVQWLLTTSLDRLMLQWVPSVTVISCALIMKSGGAGNRSS